MEVQRARGPDRGVGLQDKNNPNRPPNTPVTERRFCKFGGGLSAQQLSWLKEQLCLAHGLGQRAVIFCHLALHPATCLAACLLWNFEEVLGLVHEFRNTIVATFSGHAHQVRWPSCQSP